MATKDKQLIAKNNANYYQKNKQRYAEWRNQRRKEIREWVWQYKRTHPCPCGEDHPAALVFHHEGNKDIDVSLISNKQWSQARLEAEVAKCKVICSNCHLKLHYNSRVVSSIGRAVDS